MAPLPPSLGIQPPLGAAAQRRFGAPLQRPYTEGWIRRRGSAALVDHGRRACRTIIAAGRRRLARSMGGGGDRPARGRRHGGVPALGRHRRGRGHLEGLPHLRLWHARAAGGALAGVAPARCPATDAAAALALGPRPGRGRGAGGDRRPGRLGARHRAARAGCPAPGGDDHAARAGRFPSAGVPAALSLSRGARRRRSDRAAPGADGALCRRRARARGRPGPARRAADPDPERHVPRRRSLRGAPLPSGLARGRRPARVSVLP